MMIRRIRHVDAFTSTPLEGNPAAVVDGEGLDTPTMQRIALNQRLSETVFLLPATSSDHDAAARIFTPAVELPFAGHPTIAAAHILVSEAIVDLRDGAPLRLSLGVGIIPVEVDPGQPPLYTMTQAAPEFRQSDFVADDLAARLGLTPGDVVRSEWVSTGIFWLVAQIVSLDAMLRVQPDLTALTTIPHGIAIFCLGAQSPDAQVHVRAFAPDAGVAEDPVTGSANGCIGALIAARELLPERDGAISYVAEQGIEMGQPGRVHVRVTGGPAAPIVHVGGHAVTVLEGELRLPG